MIEKAKPAGIKSWPEDDRPREKNRGQLTLSPIYLLREDI